MPLPPGPPAAASRLPAEEMLCLQEGLLIPAFCAFTSSLYIPFLSFFMSHKLFLTTETVNWM